MHFLCLYPLILHIMISIGNVQHADLLVYGNIISDYKVKNLFQSLCCVWIKNCINLISHPNFVCKCVKKMQIFKIWIHKSWALKISKIKNPRNLKFKIREICMKNHQKGTLTVLFAKCRMTQLGQTSAKVLLDNGSGQVRVELEWVWEYIDLNITRDGNKTLTHLQPAKPAPFKTQMGGESGF